MKGFRASAPLGFGAFGDFGLSMRAFLLCHPVLEHGMSPVRLVGFPVRHAWVNLS